MQKLIAEKRDLKTKAQNIRLTGKIPAIFYGRKTESTPISVPHGDFIKVWKEAGESAIINLSYGGKDLNVLIYDVALDPVRDFPIHADFYVVEADRPVEVSVQIEFTGEAPVQKEEGVSVVKALHEVEIKGLPKDLPQSLTVDLSALVTIESQIFDKNISLPTGITLVTDPDEVVAAVSVAKVEEEVPVAEFDPTKIEVEKKGKEEVEGEEGATGETLPPKPSGKGGSVSGGKKGEGKEKSKDKPKEKS
ncbi:MAG: 50S ribosomal protein L25 [bacterium]|nr:50S ribosomal protein L25 [bacterium]